jgi:hypothetical protein
MTTRRPTLTIRLGTYPFLQVIGNRKTDVGTGLSLFDATLAIEKLSRCAERSFVKFFDAI